MSWGVSYSARQQQRHEDSAVPHEPAAGPVASPSSGHFHHHHHQALPRSPGRRHAASPRYDTTRRRHSPDPPRPSFIHEGRIMNHAGSVFDKLTDPSLFTGSHKCRFDARGRGRGLDGVDSGTVYAAENVQATQAGAGAPYWGDDREGNRWSRTLRSGLYSRTVDDRVRQRQVQTEREQEVYRWYNHARRQIDRPDYEPGSLSAAAGPDGHVDPVYETWQFDPRSGSLVLTEHVEPPVPTATTAGAAPGAHDAPLGPSPTTYTSAPQHEAYDHAPPSAVDSAPPPFVATTRPPPTSSHEQELLQEAQRTARAADAAERYRTRSDAPEVRIAADLPTRTLQPWEEQMLSQRAGPAPAPTAAVPVNRGPAPAALDHQHHHTSTPMPGSAHAAMPLQHVVPPPPRHQRGMWADDADGSQRAPTVDELLQVVEARSVGRHQRLYHYDHQAAPGDPNNSLGGGHPPHH